ncbi:hypothetical protein CDAR_320161 [Caerostris darwini]|uniref:Uncharacterized protein n=1 Tax=Caerostris darwini TaxID=1538125 RepID=A0AAV4NHE9_9ARAC|nr:hypothetical protein CDAR_320161 [Caerostris darwini]
MNVQSNDPSFLNCSYSTARGNFHPRELSEMATSIADCSNAYLPYHNPHRYVTPLRQLPKRALTAANSGTNGSTVVDRQLFSHPLNERRRRRRLFIHTNYTIDGRPEYSPT